MKNLKIEIPEGYCIDECNSTFENIVFKKAGTTHNENKIYLFKGVRHYYKLHKVVSGNFAFISLDASQPWADGEWDRKDLNKVIKKNNASEFDNIRDAISKGFFS